MNYKVLVAAALAATVVQAGAVEESLPEPWFKNGQSPAVDRCQAGVDSELASFGTPNITLRCETAADGFVSVMQQFSAEHYRGTRVRYSARIRSEGIEGWAGLWMRVDNADRPNAAFDNMQNRAVRGTQDWESHEIVLDVSQEASVVSIGTLLSGGGRGQLWISDLRVEIVGHDVPVTDMRVDRHLATEPRNLELAP